MVLNIRNFLIFWDLIAPRYTINNKRIHEIYDQNYAQNYNQRFLLNDLSKIDADFERETIAQLLDEIGDNPRWLDVACGTGYFLGCFPEVERAGLDISPAMLETARQANPNIPLIQGDYRDKRPEWEGKWDLVSCMWWAYCYVKSLAEFETVVENFVSWTSDRGICFVPIFHPSELGSGEIKLPYTSEGRADGVGVYQFEGIIWSWIEKDRTKQHLNLIAPHPEYMITLFERYFEQVEIVKYPQHERQRMALVARQKKLKHQRSRQEKTGVDFARLIRSQEWWLYKIAPLLTIAYAETLLLQLPPTTATLTTLTALLSIASVAAYGYLLNDICDIETDQKANKPNAAANLQPWQRLLLCLLFLGIGFAAPLLTHLGTIPLALLAANYLLPTLYSVPPLRLKERGIWGILSDAAGAHLVPTLFVAAPLLSHTPDPPRNALLFTGVAAAHAFFVGLRGILLHQLWDRANDLNAGITTFVTQRPPETVQRWINRLVFPVELLLLSGVALLLCQSTPALTAFFAVYLLLTAVNIKTAPHPFTPSPPKNQNIIPHDLYEVWLPLALAITLAVQNPQFLIFVALTALLFYPSIKVRTTELFQVIKAGFTPMPNPTPSTPEAPHPTPSNVAPLTLAMQQQLETEGYVVLENFLTPDELEDLREFDRAHPLPEDLVNSDKPPISLLSSDLSYRQDLEGYFKMIAAPKIDLILPGYRTLFCPWTRRPPHANNKSLNLHQDPSFTDESLYACLGIWTPLSDVEIENSCICLVKGSHKLLPRKRAYTQPGLPFDREVQSYIEQNYLTYVPLKAGQAVLFDRRLVHGASPNEGNVERVAPTCLIIIPKDAPLYCIHAASIESGMHQIEIYEVDDNFYERSLFGEKPQGDGVTLIKTEPYTYDPLTLELIAEKLDPLHPDRAIPRLKTELATLQTHLEQSRSQLQGELTAANEQLHQKTTELATLKEDYSQTQAELEHLRKQLQTTQTQHQQTQAELECDRTQLQQTEAELERDRTQLQQTQAELEQSQQQLQQTQIQLQISERQQQQAQALLEEFQAELSQKTAELNQIKSEQHRDRLAEIIRRRFYSQG